MQPLALDLEPHPLAQIAAFVTSFSRPLREMRSPDGLVELLRLDCNAPLQRDEATRQSVRDVLRHGGYKPTGRGKPASEYLVRAAQDGGLRPINAAVDAANAVSLHSGFPISVADVRRLNEPLSIGIAAPGSTYAFNPSGQVIDVSGLLCLHDAAGPCASPVKDSQRTKTHDETVQTLSLVWGVRAWSKHLDTALAWYRELLEDLGAATVVVPCAGND